MNEPATNAVAQASAPGPAGHEGALLRCVAYRNGAKLADISARV